jgi:mannose/cellobiose epimerase-like protein (N-acyl-D-glucosamine 2-epimerase family)
MSTIGTLDAVEALVRFASGSVVPDGFGSLDADGRPDPSVPLAALTTTRMTHVFAVAALLGMPGTAGLAEHGIHSLATRWRDPVDGGFLASLAGTPDSYRKGAYDLSFVVLAASSGVVAGVPGASGLLRHALDLVESRHWSEVDGALIESWDRGYAEREPYWGANANMHGVEALLAAFGATGDERWRDRALVIAGVFVDRHARANGWRLVEHFDAAWVPLPEYHRDDPRHVFRPYGMTPGHLLEWSRLLLELESCLPDPPTWLREASGALYSTAIRLGWAVDGHPGFVYTVDWSGSPVVRLRLHWVLAEAIAAAGTWRRVDDDPRYPEDLARWRRFAADHVVDGTTGSWHHELDDRNRPSDEMVRGGPDAYHILTALLGPELPLGPSLATRVREYVSPELPNSAVSRSPESRAGAGRPPENREGSPEKREGG